MISDGYLNASDRYEYLGGPVLLRVKSAFIFGPCRIFSKGESTGALSKFALHGADQPGNGL
jgi:hypothetical protein